MMDRKKSQEIAEPKKPPEPLQWPGEPERKCGNCQHWRPLPTKGKGECHNLISQFMETRETSCCARGFYPNVDRFPLADRLAAT